MGFDPAMGGEVHGNARGEEAEADRQCSDDPVQLDTAFEEAEIKDAKDQDKNGRFGEESRTATRGNDQQIEERRGGWGFRGKR